MNISELAVRRPVTIGIITVLLVSMAFFMIPKLAVAMIPDVEAPVVLVRTSYSGANPLEVEQSITEILEKQLSDVSGLKSVTSTSSSGSSIIVLEFGYDKDLTEAVNDIRDSLEGATDMLPDDADSPVIMKIDLNSEPIMKLIMEGDESADTMKWLAEDTVQPLLERIEGVSSADVTGGETRAIRVDLSLNRLEAYGLTVSQITSALSSQNLQMSGGTLNLDNLNYDLKVDEEYATVEEIARTVVATLNPELEPGESVNRSSIVRLEDVAHVYEGYEEKESLFYVNGKPAISIEINNESDTNTVNVANSVKEVLPTINESLPEGVSIKILVDDTDYINSVLNQVYSSAWQGIILAMAILFLFLRNLRSTLIIGLSIPVSIIITLMFMYFFDITLNMMSLTGLILGLGMIVDNSIVILENIHQYRERGAKLKPSAILGSQEMINSITASTLTTLCVFLPMIIWKDGLEMIGEMFSDMMFTVVISLVVSYLTAVALVPALSSKFIKLYTHKQRPIKNHVLTKLDRLGSSALEGIERGYKTGLGFALRNRLMVITLIVVALVFSIAGFSTLGISIFPTDDSDDSVIIDVEMPVGTDLDKTEEVLLQLKDIVTEEITGYEELILSVGGSGMFSSGSTNEGSIEITLPDLEDQTITAAEIENILRPYISLFPDAEITFDSGQDFGSGSPVDLVIYSNDLDLASETATTIKNLIKELPEIVDPVTDMDDGSPEYRVVIDKDRAAVYGLSVQEVASVINGLVDGSTPTTYWDDSEELDVIVQLAEEDRAGLPDLDAIYILTGSGQKISLSNLATYTLSVGPKDISREDETRTVHVTADLTPGVGANQIQPQIQSLLDEKLILPDGVSYEFAGDQMDFKDMVPTLITVFVVALLMIFAIMASQFESLADPFIIFFSIPLLLIGVMGIYLVSGAVFSLFSFIGMVVLMGIVVNNGIVMVDYMNLLRKRGYGLDEAVMEGAVSRLRPVLMTSLTTILSMVPMGFFPGEGTDMIQPIGQTIVGGLTSSTLITLFITPVVYTLVNREKKIKKSDAGPEEPAGKAIA